ncbi:MAG: dephospho-CoA kinase [Kiritimatiellales bacterium]|nr:dephospho-CoA kinase [Kiritimatiellales bacterium]
MSSHQPIILGLTGGIACGKSEVGRILQQNGFAVLDTDTLAHELMTAGGPVFKTVVKRFGESVLGADGEIDRKELGKIVFENPDALKALNELVHPAVIEAAEQWKAQQRGDAAVMVPLLFETGWTNGWSAIICVSAEEEVVFQRLEKRGLSEAEARKRIAAQMPLTEKEKQSDFILKNNETLDALRNETVKVLEALRSRGTDHE